MTIILLFPKKAEEEESVAGEEESVAGEGRVLLTTARVLIVRRMDRRLGEEGTEESTHGKMEEV